MAHPARRKLNEDLTVFGFGEIDIAQSQWLSKLLQYGRTDSHCDSP
jgi:hypothetical protein